MESSISSYDFIGKYKSIGADKFYRFLVSYGVNKLAKLKNNKKDDASPEIELLEYHDRFMTAYRKSGETEFLELARVFRRAAHKIYRASLKSNLTKKNTRFLNVVQQKVSNK